MLPQATAEHYQQQQRHTIATLAHLRRLWAQVSPTDFDAAWETLGPRMLLLLTAAQLSAATAGAEYVPAVLSETGQDSSTFEAVAPESLAGVASDGRSLSGLLYVPVLQAKAAQAEGVSDSDVMTLGRSVLTRIVVTQLADAARVAAGVAIASRPRVSGYVRMLNPPSCSRCAILAGKRYKWNAGFDRHPRCDCRHIPASEDVARDLRTDPREYFDSLTPAEQNHAFTNAGAQAIRDGADVNQVVNARRGAAGLTPAGARLTADEKKAIIGDRKHGVLQRRDVYGEQLFTTTEGTTRHGSAYGAMKQAGYAKGGDVRTGRNFSAKAPRLMPESIYEIAEDRADAIRLLKLYGYLL